MTTESVHGFDCALFCGQPIIGGTGVQPHSATCTETHVCATCDQTIYVGAYGFRDNDAIGRVWAKDVATFNTAMESAMRDTAETYGDGEWCTEHESSECECDMTEQTFDSLWYVGPFEQTIAQTANDLEERARLAEFLDDVATSESGYVY